MTEQQREEAAHIGDAEQTQRNRQALDKKQDSTPSLPDYVQQQYLESSNDIQQCQNSNNCLSGMSCVCNDLKDCCEFEARDVDTKANTDVASGDIQLGFAKNASRSGKAWQNYQHELEAQKSCERMSKALYWLQCAAEAGHPRAQYQLGKDLAQSDDSADMAVYWLQKAAVHGVGEAVAELEELDSRGHQNVTTRIDKQQLYTKAASALQIAADVGDLVATVEFAVCCWQGYGVELYKAKAFKLYQEHAERENARAKVKLGKCYAYGVDVDFNCNLAVQCYNNAVQHGSMQRMLELAIYVRDSCNQCGCGTTAFELLKLAAEHRASKRNSNLESL